MVMYNSWTPRAPFSPYTPYEGQALRPTAHSTSLPAPSRRVSNASALIPPATPRLEPIPLPPMSVDDTTPNTMVTYAGRPHIQYDVRHHPGYASAPKERQHWLQEPATNPPTPKMVIVCMVLPRPFVVYPASKELNYVTVRDLLAATHSAFREAARGAVADDETWVPGFSLWSGASYTWAGLSEQSAPCNWLLHIE
ncbi:hypothetical protein M378DRAFT_169382 [Amanita muscaria Koide BX008]|uniref:DUF6699 domain-containing protein n=1 Tax=Amanita muscaria (strain Koide BX008) TaxID=946122 RepID=A0A0C2S9F4_AMAMK|nr:hypothetical protein M378DRAFT_169382 [Amanita muscaria Koide BX008]